MSTLDEIANFLGYSPKVKAVDQAKRPLLRASFLKGQPIKPGSKVTDYLGAYKSWSFACVRAINREVMNIELKLYRRKSQEEFEMVDSHPVLDLLYNVNPIYTSYDLWEATSGHMELAGESYWWLVGGAKNPKEIWVLRPDWMDIKDTKNKIIESYSYGAHGDRKITIPFEEVIPFKDFNPKNPYRGYGGVRAAAAAIDTDDFASEYNRSFFTNSGRPGGALQTESELSDEAYERIREEWEKVHKGTDNSWKVAILEGGLKWQDVGLSQKDMDFLAGRKFNRDEILTIFGVPKPLVSITDDVNRANAREARAIFLENTITPKLQKYAASLTEFLLPRYADGENLFFDIENPVPDDMDLTLKQVDTNARHGTMTLNELRELQGKEAVEGGDVFFVPFGKEISEAKVTNSLSTKKDSEENSDPKFKFNVRPKTYPHSKTSFERGLKNLTKKSEKLLYMMLKKKQEKQAPETDSKEISKENGADDHWKDTAWKAVIQRTDSREAKMIHTLVRLFDEQEQKVLNNLDNDFNLSAKKLTKKVKANISEIADVTADDDIFAAPLMDLIEQYIETEGIIRIQEVVADKVFVHSEQVDQYLRKEGAKFVTQVNETTTEQLRNAIADGVIEGESIPEIKSRIQSVYNQARDTRAERIARTEVIKSSNFAATEAYRQSGVVETKEWLATRDDRVRPEHAAADGQEVALGENFRVGGEDLEYPGDPSGSARNIVNCRCTVIPHIIREKGSKKKLNKKSSDVSIKDK